MSQTEAIAANAAVTGSAAEKAEKLNRIASMLIFPAAILYMELMTKLMIFHNIFNTGLIYTPLFSLAGGFLLTMLCSLGSEKANRRLTCILLFAVAVFYIFEYDYFAIFKSFFTLSTLGIAGDVTEFWLETVKLVFRNFYAIIVFLVPYLLFMIFGRRRIIIRRPQKFGWLKLLCVAAVCHIAAVGCINMTSGDYSDNYYYHSVLSTSDGVYKFGVLTTARIDFQQTLFGRPEEKVENPYADSEKVDALLDVSTTTNISSPSADKSDGYNEMDIDFDKLIADCTDEEIKDMHKYFSTVSPTAKNQFTGMFEGKNLIYMTLEGFSYKCVSPELTPNLYKMLNEGFVFENYYNTLWGGSTATGEYAAMTGNFYTSANCLKKSSTNYMPFAMGNQFSKLGYTCRAYHDHTYTYYSRNLSHPNMGFIYKGIGSGLDGLTECWPRSDEEMAAVTIGEYASDTPFMTYYMTVSGHGSYSFDDNAQSANNRSRVDNLPYSDEVKAYIACNLEVEDMVTTLINKLDAAGILDDTVFVMNADHYPYLLSDEALSELYGLDENGIRENFDLYRNGLIIWSSSMKEPVRVTTPCSSIDIIPTVSNLFGLEYDSRLIMGTDILSGTAPIVLLNCDGAGGAWHWITACGAYNTRTKLFAKSESCELDDSEIAEYVSTVNKIVQLKRNYSMKLLELDYYAEVFGKTK